MHLHPAFRSVQFRCQGARSGPLRQRGVVLLLVFAIVGWYQRRQRNSGPDNRRENRD